jgi:hypothetical protein
MTWKGYTPQVIDALRRTFSVGLREGPVTFEDYSAIRRYFRTSGIPVGPTIDLCSADLEEDPDGP